MFKVVQASFLRGILRPYELLGNESAVRIGFAGRSNVGKSTFLNRLAARKNLAQTGATPGRTKQFNLYQIEVLMPHETRGFFHFIDFPGFGYAKFSQAQRKALRRQILAFVEEESVLQMLCLLNDSRRMPEADELDLRNIAAASGIHVLVVVTKTDKLRRNDLKPQLQKIAGAYGLEPHDIVAAGSDVSTERIWERFGAFFSSVTRN